MTRRKPAQSTKDAPDTETAGQFAAEFFAQWQAQWREMMAQNGMAFDAMGLNGFIPLQQIGPMGLLAPFGAVALANLKLLQELQARVEKLEAAQKRPMAKRARKKASP